MTLFRVLDLEFRSLIRDPRVDLRRFMPHIHRMAPEIQISTQMCITNKFYILLSTAIHEGQVTSRLRLAEGDFRNVNGGREKSVYLRPILTFTGP